ncbi:MAG: glycosyltransferase family 1 protein, partial [Gammaproteobacteria bacterium]
MTVRIVHAGNFLRRRYGHAKTSNEHKLFFGFIRNDFKAYEFSDRDTARFESVLKSRHFGARAANRRLLEMCDNVRPDLLLVAHADLVTNATLNEIRRLIPGVRIAYRFEDPPYVAENREKIRHRLGVVDIMFLGFAGELLREYATTSTEVAFLPHPTDPCVENLCNFERDEFDTDLLFCGIGNTSDDRYGLVGALLQDLSDVRFRVCGMHGFPTVLGL